jgi:hypothetical protein
MTSKIKDFADRKRPDKRHENAGRPQKYTADWIPRGVRFPPELAQKMMEDAKDSHRTFSEQVRYLVEAGYRAAYPTRDRGFLDRIFGRNNS